MITALVVLLTIAGILLTIIVLVQNPKGGGLSSEFGGSGSSQMFGVQRTGDLVSRLTWGLFTFIAVGSILVLVLFKTLGTGDHRSSDVNVETSTTAPALPISPVIPAPEAPTATDTEN